MLGEGQVGWDWFSLNLDDGSDLMIYQLRQEDGSSSPTSSGTYRRKDGEVFHLKAEQFQLRPSLPWKSKASGGEYPTRWQITVPQHQIDLEVDAAFPSQEMALFPITYWEGSVSVQGTQQGQGYMELTGYAGQVPLQ